jgi:hypothetical protein
MDETGWVIERFYNGELRYWIGSSTDDVGFLPDNQKAIRFAREQDATYVLSWMLGGHGRAAEHMWCGDKIDGVKP